MNFDGIYPNGSDKIEDSEEKRKRLLELSLPRDVYERRLNETTQNKKNLLENKSTEKQSPKPHSSKEIETVIKEIKAPDGYTYGIVQERGSKFYIKKKTKNGYQYIGGQKNLNEYCYPNEAKASRHLNFMLKEINRNSGYHKDINVLKPTLNESHDKDSDESPQDRQKEIDDLARVSSDEFGSEEQYKRSGEMLRQQGQEKSKEDRQKEIDDLARMSSDEFSSEEQYRRYDQLDEEEGEKEEDNDDRFARKLASYSEREQELFHAGMAMSAKRGMMRPQDLRPRSQEMYYNMSEKEIKSKYFGLLEEDSDYEGPYVNMFFAQGEDAEPYLDMIDEQGPADTLDYIVDEVGDKTFDTEDVYVENPAGEEDKRYEKGGYELCYNFRLDTVGVTMKIQNMIELDNLYEIKVDDEDYDNTDYSYEDELDPMDMKKTESKRFKKKDILREEDEEDPCWKNYEMVGMKTDENGEEVPNCVPKDEVDEYAQSPSQSFRQNQTDRIGEDNMMKYYGRYLDEDEKFVLDTGDEDSEPSDDEMGDEDMADTDMSDEETDEEGFDSDEDSAEIPDEEESEDPTKMLQSYTGKLGYLINQYKDDESVMDEDMVKYIVNGVLENIDFSLVDEDTKEEFMSQIQGENNDGEDGDDFDGPEDASDIAVGDDTASAAPMAGGDAGGGADSMGDAGGDAMEEGKRGIHGGKRKRRTKYKQRSGDYIEEDDSPEDDPCWDGYEQYGTKMKNGKEVPNCVKKEGKKGKKSIKEIAKRNTRKLKERKTLKENKARKKSIKEVAKNNNKKLRK